MHGMLVTLSALLPSEQELCSSIEEVFAISIRDIFCILFPYTRLFGIHAIPSTIHYREWKKIINHKSAFKLASFDPRKKYTHKELI